MERLGILGGTFDPPHLGHLILASVACDVLALDKVLFVPAADPPHKQARRITPVEHRLAMLQDAIAGDPRFLISRVDVDRAGPHFSVDMIALVQTQYPQADLYFLMGSDSLHELVGWYQAEQLLQACRLAVLPRPGAVVDRHELITAWGALHERILFIEGPFIDLSSTCIQERWRARQSIRYLVPSAVLEYIGAHGLYP